MKFAKHLEANSIPEWRKAYINYKGLKKRLAAIEKYRKVHQIEDRMDMANALAAVEGSDPYNVSTPLLRNSNRAQNSIPDFELRYRSTTSARNSSSLFMLDNVLRYASNPERYFFVMLDKDLQTISEFYDEKEKEAEAKFEALKIQVQIVHEYAVHLSLQNSAPYAINGNTPLNPMKWFKRRDSTLSNITRVIPNLPSSLEYNGNEHLSYSVTRSRLKNAITEYYRSLQLIKSYKDLNMLGFQKILKKFDKTAGWKASNLYIQKVDMCNWSKSTKIEEFTTETEKLFVDEFADGHRRKGMAKLRTPEKNETYSATTCRIGFYIGLSFALFARVIQLALAPDIIDTLPDLVYNLQIYACFSLPILFCLGFAINTLVWTKSHISYKFIFEFDPRDNLDYQQFAELPSLMLLLLSFTMYIDFSQCFSPLIPSKLCPLIFFVVIMAIMVCPFNILYYTSRRWLIFSLGRILLSYVFPIEFRDFFIADELNSLAYSFWTFSYFACAYRFHWIDLAVQCSVKLFWFTPVLASLPAWWRFLQCIRRYKDSREKVHLVNGLKYVTSIGSAVAGSLRRMYPTTSIKIAWILCCIINSSYTSAWDLKMDWGLLQPKTKHALLRNDLVFSRWCYYAAAPVNVLLRFSWTLTLNNLGMNADLMGYVIALLEAYRRIQWNFFRLENEHINNCGNYRAIKEIPLPFAFHEYSKSTASIAEEGGIQLPVEPYDIPVPPNAVCATHTEYVDTPFGSFYGRRDFESRQDLEDNISYAGSVFGFNRQPSMVSLVLDHIISRKQSRQDSSDTEDDDDHNQRDK